MPLEVSLRAYRGFWGSFMGLYQFLCRAIVKEFNLSYQNGEVGSRVYKLPKWGGRFRGL